MPFRSIQRVYFDDLDALNILHNVRFLLFMERARGELLLELGFRWEDDISVNPDKYHVVAPDYPGYGHSAMASSRSRCSRRTSVARARCSMRR